MFHHQGSLPWTRLLLIYEWNVEHASKGVLLQKISSHSHRPLNFYPRKLETEGRKLLCLTIFYEWSKAAVVTSQLGSTRVSGSQHNTTTSASVAKKHIPHPFHSHTLGALSMLSTHRVVLGRTADSLPRWRWHISDCEKGPFSRVSSAAHLLVERNKENY